MVLILCMQMAPNHVASHKFGAHCGLSKKNQSKVTNPLTCLGIIYVSTYYVSSMYPSILCK